MLDAKEIEEVKKLMNTLQKRSLSPFERLVYKLLSLFQKFLLEGHMEVKSVRKASPSAGAIFVNKKHIGKTYKVIMIPEKVPLNERLIQNQKQRERIKKQSIDIDRELEKARRETEDSTGIFDQPYKDKDKFKLPT